MVDSREFARWWEAARSARQSAVIQSDAEQHHWACFLAEQAAQLALKGLMHGIGEASWGHDLVDLGSRLEHSIGDAMPDSTRGALQRLSRHYIPTRYPDAHPSGPPGAYYNREDVRRALEDLDAVLEHVQGLWAQLAVDDREGGS